MTLESVSLLTIIDVEPGGVPGEGDVLERVPGVDGPLGHGAPTASTHHPSLLLLLLLFVTHKVYKLGDTLSI